MKVIFVCCIAFCAVGAIYSFNINELIEEEWSLFKLQFKKLYNDVVEEKFRRKIYMDNKLKIARHNQMYENGEETFQMEMNHFGDLMQHEYASLVNGFLGKRVGGTQNYTDEDAVTFLKSENVVLPSTVDWRKKGYVTPVKNQGQCGSCWSFSATGALEGQHFRKTGVLVSLSEQNLIDCSGKYGNNGCEGGLMDQAFKYIKANKGLDTEKSYPYEAEDDKCRYKAENSGATDKGFVDIPEGDEESLMHALATVGPISIAIDASSEKFQFYKKGVYYNPHCSSEQLDHGVLAVGYGTDSKGGDYWIVKNSWGTTWGDHGYVLMARNKSNNCGIASSASYPLV
ncbi:procathepsin L [Daktulosphaira vitifoliae]|uniref:procathepsin L n=1 Tax=Daktulosphaira vitifoliae TaxID=58002 RepID=UPI0021AA697E|nr:procathepsin L [Daktulosphaira vitifoliae]XP_050521098.1 procathepsin L [Daktulosphaira vitifoliae]